MAAIQIATFYHLVEDDVNYIEAHLSSGDYIASVEQLEATTFEVAMDKMAGVDGIEELALTEPGRLAIRVMAAGADQTA